MAFVKEKKKKKSCLPFLFVFHKTVSPPLVVQEFDPVHLSFRSQPPSSFDLNRCHRPIRASATAVVRFQPPPSPPPSDTSLRCLIQLLCKKPQKSVFDCRRWVLIVRLFVVARSCSFATLCVVLVCICGCWLYFVIVFSC